jgi:hypothetical protein
MKALTLESALAARPFRPFEIRVDGEIIQVRHPEQLFFAEKKTTVIVDAADRIHIFDTSHIGKLALIRRPPSEGTARKK